MNLSALSNGDLDRVVIARERSKLFTLYRDLFPTSTKEWLVKNLLGHGEASAAYGAPGSGKSALVEDMGLHVAGGIAWQGREVRQGAVVYVALERRQLVERRAIAFREYHGIPDLPFAIVGGVYDFRDVRTVQAIAGIIREIEEATGDKVVLVIIDTVSRALAGGDENSPKDMGAIVTATARLQEATQAHIQWVHHVPVDAGERLRGHGALLGALDTTINVEKHSNELRTATVVKANDSEEGERIAFKLDSVTIGPETTAPVVTMLDDNAVNSAKPARKLSAKHQLAMSALAEAVLANGQPAPGEYQLPAGVKVVTREQWKEELYRRNILDRSYSNPRVQFSRLHDPLAAKALIGSRDDFVWLAGS